MTLAFSLYIMKRFLWACFLVFYTLKILKNNFYLLTYFFIILRIRKTFIIFKSLVLAQKQTSLKIVEIIIKTPVSEEIQSLVLIGCHAIPLVTRCCFLLNSVTYGTPCHNIVYQVIYHECYRFERSFFTLWWFLPYINSCISSLPWGWHLSLKVSQASYLDSKHSPGPTICLNHTAIYKFNVQKIPYLNISNIIVNYLWWEV